MHMSALSGIHKHNSSDEWYTPDDAVRDIVPFIDKNRFRRILCPFDCAESAFVRIFREEGFDVTYGDILHEGKDFFAAWDFAEYDIVISNPPFSMRGSILERLIDADVPFCLLLNPDGIVDCRGRYNLLRDHLCYMQMLLPRGRVNYVDSETRKRIGVPFYSAWLARRLLPPQNNVLQQIIFMDKED